MMFTWGNWEHVNMWPDPIKVTEEDYHIAAVKMLAGIILGGFYFSLTLIITLIIFLKLNAA